MAAHIREYQTHHVPIHLTAADQAHRWNAQTLAIKISRQPHRTGRRPTDICVVRAIGNVEKTGGRWQAAGGRRTDSWRLPPGACHLIEDSHNQRHVGKMSAAGKRIVEGYDIARL